MVKVEIGKHNFALDGYLYNNLISIRKDLRKDNDYVLIIEGYEGVGKSTLGCQAGLIVDNGLTIEKVAFDGEQFLDRLKEVDIYSTVIFDEAGVALFSRESQEEFNRLLIKIFMISRVRKLFIILIIPSFLFIDQYIRSHRGKALIHCYTKVDSKGIRHKGFFRCYTRTGMNMIHAQKSYKGVRPAFYGRFSKYNPIPEYSEVSEKWKLNYDPVTKKDKKLIALDAKYKNTLEQRDKLILALVKKGITGKVIGETIGLGHTAVNCICKAQSLNTITPILNQVATNENKFKEIEEINEKLILLLGNIKRLKVIKLAEYLNIDRYSLDKIIRGKPIDKNLDILMKLNEVGGS